MRTSWTRRLAGAAGLFAAACWLTAAGTPTVAKDDVPDPVLKALIEKDVAYLQKALSGKVEKRAVNTVKATAMLVAAYAQKSGNGALQDQALAVAAAVGKKDFAGAKAAAAKLSGAAGGSPKAVALQEKTNLDEIMSTYRNGTVGGLNMEKDIRAQGKKLSDVKLAAELGARSAVIADYALKLAPADANGTKKKQWDDWCKEMAALGADVAAEAGKGAGADKAAVEKKLKALDANCTACHNVFRN